MFWLEVRCAVIFVRKSECIPHAAVVPRCCTHVTRATTGVRRSRERWARSTEHMLKIRRSDGYKALARKADVRECLVFDKPLQELVVDVRSRVFMYMRTRYLNAPLKDKISRLFMAMSDLEGERKRVFRAAIAVAKQEVSFMGVRRVTYAFGSCASCAYKEPLRQERQALTVAKLDEFKSRAAKLRSNMLDVELLSECIAALESYMVSDLDGVCSAYRGKEWLFVPASSYVVAGAADMFESDRLCARLAHGRPSGVLSEDFDCMALFGANFMVKEVYRGFFTYATLKGIMDAFGSTTRDVLVEKCCLLGTDYNLGLMGVGPVKVRKIDDIETHRLCKACLAAQNIVQSRIRDFLLL